MIQSTLGTFESQQEYQKAYRKAHYAELKLRVKDIRNYLLAQRKQCIHCGETHPACLDFHHRNPKEKSFRLVANQIGNRSLKSIEREIAKCDVLCANCHRKHHYKEGYLWLNS